METPGCVAQVSEPASQPSEVPRQQRFFEFTGLGFRVLDTSRHHMPSPSATTLESAVVPPGSSSANSNPLAVAPAASCSLEPDLVNVLTKTHKVMQGSSSLDLRYSFMRPRQLQYHVSAEINSTVKDCALQCRRLGAHSLRFTIFSHTNGRMKAPRPENFPCFYGASYLE